MENGGWIKLHRRILNNPICTNHKYGWLWIVLLLEATHKDTEFLIGNKLIKLKKGQLLTGRKKLSKDSGIKEGTVETILDYLESQQQIQQQKTTRYRVITIVNWDKYQTDEQQLQQQNDNKMTHTRKERKERIRNKNTVVSGDTPIRFVKFMEIFNKTTGRNFKSDIKIKAVAKIYKEFCDRLGEGYTSEEILTALDNAVSDPFLTGKNDRNKNYLTPEYILRADKLEQWRQN